MTTASGDELLHLCTAAITTLAGDAQVELSDGEIMRLAAQLQQRAQHRGVSDPAQIETMARNYLADGETVRALLDQQDPSHEQRWQAVHSVILRWLHARGDYPDDLTLDERAPDIATIGDLKRALPTFDHVCQLDTFIISLTKRRAQIWQREQDAAKRGGGGIFTRQRRQQPAPSAAQRRARVRYLSELISEEATLEELLGADGRDLSELVEQRALLELILREAQAQAREERDGLILRLWYEALIEGCSYNDLAERHRLKHSQISALFRRFKPRLQAVIRRWLEQDGSEF